MAIVLPLGHTVDGCDIRFGTMGTHLLPFVQGYVLFCPVGFKKESITTGNMCFSRGLKQEVYLRGNHRSKVSEVQE